MAKHATWAHSSFKSQLELRKYLETVAQEVGDAVNVRQLDHQQPPYAGRFADDFSIQAPLTGGRLNLPEYLGLLREITNADPGYKFEVLDVSSTIQSETKAVVFSNYQVTGSPPGVVRRGVGVLHFSLREDYWLVDGYEGHDGLEGTEGAI